MKILVCVKLVSMTKFADFLNQKVDTDRLSGGSLVINPADEVALEAALKIKDKKKDTEITVITMGPKAAENILRYAISLGADLAVHLCDKWFSGSDSIATAKILAKAIGKLEKYDLILCGQKADDSETGHIGPQLGILLGVATLCNVMELEIQGDNKLRALLVQDNGRAEYTLCLPALCSLCGKISTPSLPSIMGIRKARTSKIRTIDHYELGFDINGNEMSHTKVLNLKKCEFKPKNNKKEKDTQIGGAEIVSIIKRSVL